MKPDIQLSDGLILLRAPKASDVPAIQQAIRESLTELHPWMDWATDDYDEASTWRWLEAIQLAWEHASGFHFAITDAHSGEYIGGCSVDGINEKLRSCNLGYWVRTSRTGQGIASQAASLAAKFAFETVGLTRVEIVIAVENVASQRTAQKAGAHYEGVLLNRMVVRSDVYNAMLFSLNPADFGLPG